MASTGRLIWRGPGVLREDVSDNDTSRFLAYALVVILALTIVLQYGLTALMIVLGKQEGLALLDKIFNDLLPVLAGLCGGACTYYFTSKKE